MNGTMRAANEGPSPSERTRSQATVAAWNARPLSFGERPACEAVYGGPFFPYTEAARAADTRAWAAWCDAAIAHSVAYWRGASVGESG
jgi:hypothetical protein